MKRPLLLFIFGLLLCATCNAQEKERIDSLLSEIQKAKNDSEVVWLYIDIISTHDYYKPEEGLKYEKPALEVAERMKWKPGIAAIKTNIGRLHWRMGNFNQALKYHFEALKISEEAGKKKQIIGALAQIGQDYGDAGNYPDARVYFLRALKISEEIEDKYNQGYLYFLFSWLYHQQGDYLQSSKANIEALKIYEVLKDSASIAIALSNIGGDMENLNNNAEALNYYNRAIEILRKLNDRVNLGLSYNDLGRIFSEHGYWDAAMKNYFAALQIANEISDSFIASQSYRNIGEVYLEQGNYSKALENYLRAVSGFKSISNKMELAGVYSEIGICFTRLKQFDDAEKYFNEARTLSNELDSKKSYGEYYKGMDMLDSVRGRWHDAYFNYKRYIVLRDSMLNFESAKKMVGAQMQYEGEKKELAEKAEQEKKDIRQRTIRNSIAGALAGALVFLVVVYRQRNKISKARKRSDELLLNILPSEVAEELKNKGAAAAKQFDEVTVLFTDFKNFTAVSEKLTAQDLVNEINFCYSEFDKIISKHGIEKIKTIGDAYMCAGGLPVPNKTNAEDTVRAAMEIKDFMLAEKQKREADGKTFFDIRIGCHTGPVVAGIVGIKKFAYDIWGDTVNIASRMESSGEPGKVNISGTTFELVKDKFTCTHRGKIQAKNKGEIDMYFVEG